MVVIKGEEPLRLEPTQQDKSDKNILRGRKKSAIRTISHQIFDIKVYHPNVIQAPSLSGLEVFTTLDPGHKPNLVGFVY